MQVFTSTRRGGLVHRLRGRCSVGARSSAGATAPPPRQQSLRACPAWPGHLGGFSGSLAPGSIRAGRSLCRRQGQPAVGPAAPTWASSRLPPRCPRGTRHPLTQHRAVMPGCPRHLTGRMAPSPAAAAQAMMRSPLDSYGGPCLQPPSALAKHGAGLPGTCPPTYVHSVFLSPSLSSGRGRGIPPASCPSLPFGQGLTAPPPRQQWYRCGACPGYARPGQPPLKGGRGGCGQQRVDCNGALARKRTG